MSDINDLDLLKIKLREYRDSLQEELKRLSNPDEIEALRNEMKEHTERIEAIKKRIKEIRSASQEERAKILAIARRIKAINQLLRP